MGTFFDYCYWENRTCDDILNIKQNIITLGSTMIMIIIISLGALRKKKVRMTLSTIYNTL